MGDILLTFVGASLVGYCVAEALRAWWQRPVVMWDDVNLRWRAARRIAKERGLPRCEG